MKRSLYLRVAEWLLWREVRRRARVRLFHKRGGRRTQNIVAARAALRVYTDMTLVDVIATLDYERSEESILDARLARRYDPGMALQEATNRAIAAKRVPKENGLTELQLAALEFQKREAARVVRNS